MWAWGAGMGRWAGAVGLALGVCTALGCGAVDEVSEPLREEPPRPSPAPEEEAPVPPPEEALPGDPMWTVQASLPGVQDVVGLASDGTGGVIVLATSHAVGEWGTVIEESGAWVLSRYDLMGQQLWSRALDIEPATNGPTTLRASALAVSSTGEVFIALQLLGEGTLLLGHAPPRSDHFLAKLGADGTPRWVHAEKAEALAADGAGGVVAVTRDSTVVRYDATGARLWTWKAPVTSVVFTHVAVDASGNVVAAGHRKIGLTHDQGYIVGLSADGSERWRTTTPEQQGWSTFTDLALFPDGGLLLTGTFSRTFLWGNYRVNPSCATGPCAVAPYLLAADAKGQPLWVQELSGNALKPRVAVGLEGDALVAWEAACSSSLMRLSPTGEERWKTRSTHAPCASNVLLPRDIDFLRDGTLVRAGMFSGPRTFIGGARFTADTGDVFLQRLYP